MKKICLAFVMSLLAAVAFCEETKEPMEYHEYVPAVTEGGGRLVGDYLKELAKLESPVVEVQGVIKTKGLIFKQILLVKNENSYKLKLVAESEVTREQLLKLKNKSVRITGPLDSVENEIIVMEVEVKAPQN